MYDVSNSEFWMNEASCRNDDLADLFFHAENERGLAKESRDRQAKTVCRTCPVMSSCLDYALKHQEPYGVWGGLSEDDRRAMGLNRALSAVH